MQLHVPYGIGVQDSQEFSTRPKDLTGLRIGLLDNTKAHADHILHHLEQRLSERVPGVETFYISKQHPSLPAEEEVLSTLTARADFVINALGD